MRDMSRETFEELLTLHGADLEAWPVEVRDVASRALARDVSLQALLEEERRLAIGLAGADRVPSSWNLEERIIAATRRPTVQRATAPFAWTWLEQAFADLMLPRPAYVLVVTILLGFVLGLASQGQRESVGSMKEIQMVREFLYGGAIL